MELVPLGTAIAGAAVGATLSYLYNRRLQASSPQTGIAKMDLTSVLPHGAADVVAHFPVPLAAAYNAHPECPGRIDPAKDVPLPDYLTQVKDIRETLRVRRGQLNHYQTVAQSLLLALDRADQHKFLETCSMYNEFFWGYLRGRVRRYVAPPNLPPDIVDVSAIAPRAGLHVYRDTKGDFIVDIDNSVHNVILHCADLPEHKQALGQKAASHLAKLLAEFDVDALREIVGALASDVERYITELSDLLLSVKAEERRYSFLTVSLLARNRGVRPYCLDTTARLFVGSKNYTYVNGSGVTTVVAHDWEIGLRAKQPDVSSGVLEVPGSGSRVIEFCSTRPLSELEDPEAVEKLATAGERAAYVGLRAYTENAMPTFTYSPAVRFTIAVLEPAIAPSSVAAGGR